MSDQPQGQGTPEVSQGTDVPEYVSKSEFNEQLNRAITARTKALEAKFAQSTEAMAAKFDEILTSKLEAFKPAAPTTDPAGKAAATPESAVQSPEFKELQKKLDAMASSLKSEKETRAAIEAKAKDATLRQRIAEAAAEHRVDAKRAKLLVGHLVDSEKRVAWDDASDSIVYRNDDGESVDLKSGLQTFFKSEDGKLFIPPTGASGSGERGGGKSGSAGQGGVTKEAIGSHFLKAALGVTDL